MVTRYVNIIVLSALLPFLAVLTVALRAYSRRFLSYKPEKPKLMVDDYLMLPATVCTYFYLNSRAGTLLISL